MKDFEMFRPFNDDDKKKENAVSFVKFDNLKVLQDNAMVWKVRHRFPDPSLSLKAICHVTTFLNFLKFFD